MPAVYPSLASAAGTKLSISTTAPATHDEAGFEAIAESSWEDIGYVVNAGGLPRGVREYEDVDLLDGRSMVIVGPERMEGIEIECVYQPGDEGQQTVRAAADGKTVVWLRWSLPMGQDIYAAAYLSGYAPSIEGAGSYVGVIFTARPIYDAEGVGAVYGALAP